MSRSTVLLLSLLVLLATRRADARQVTDLVFMVPVEVPAGDASGAAGLPLFQEVTDPGRLGDYATWLENGWADRARVLYRKAREIAVERGRGEGLPVAYHIALVPGGNEAHLGFRLAEADGTIHAQPRAPYMELGPEEWRFTTTFLHETGHVVLMLLAGGRAIPHRQIAAIPHTTAALTDRGTAFDEGYAIHLETLFVHLSDEEDIRNRYKREQLLFGQQRGFMGEYFGAVSDLLTFSQTLARYPEVRDNAYAFQSAFTDADYLRIQMEKTRDHARLRSPEQLLQSEGFYATFFFHLAARGTYRPEPAEAWAREERIMQVLGDLLDEPPAHAETPWLVRFPAAWAARYPDTAEAMADVFLDASHGVFLERDAAALWGRLYTAALRLDIQALPRQEIAGARARWRDLLRRDPEAPQQGLGPQLRCEVNGPTVHLVALGEEAPLSFDLNTVQPGVLALVPGLSQEAAARWIEERALRPYSSPEDFLQRVRPGPAVEGILRFTPP